MRLSINRNILECKDVKRSLDRTRTIKVLIETYWNVKSRPAAELVREPIVLIETYWNVKLGTTAAMSLTSSINRNILECKASRCLY